MEAKTYRNPRISRSAIPSWEIPRRVEKNAVVSFFKSLMEHALVSGTTVLALTVKRDDPGMTLKLGLEDNAPSCSGETGRGSSVLEGLGRGDLLRMHVSCFSRDLLMKGGALTVRGSALGGIAVEAVIPLEAVDENPVREVASRFSILAGRHPHVDFWARFQAGNRARSVWIYDLARRSSLDGGRFLDVVVGADAVFQETLGPPWGPGYGRERGGDP